MQVWVDCRRSMDDPEQMARVLGRTLHDFSREARTTAILADRKTIITLARANSRWAEFDEHCEPSWQFRTFFGVDLASTDLVATGVFVIEGERLGVPVVGMAEWGVPALSKSRPPRVAVYSPKAADEKKQDEPVKPRELDSKPDDETDNQKRDDILRKIFS